MSLKTFEKWPTNQKGGNWVTLIISWIPMILFLRKEFSWPSVFVLLFFIGTVSHFGGKWFLAIISHISLIPLGIRNMGIMTCPSDYFVLILVFAVMDSTMFSSKKSFGLSRIEELMISQLISLKLIISYRDLYLPGTESLLTLESWAWIIFTLCVASWKFLPLYPLIILNFCCLSLIVFYLLYSILISVNKFHSFLRNKSVIPWCSTDVALTTFLYWLIVTAVSIPLIFYVREKIERNIHQKWKQGHRALTRKLFHLLLFLLFYPPIHFSFLSITKEGIDIDGQRIISFISSSSLIVIWVSILIEIMRLNNISFSLLFWKTDENNNEHINKEIKIKIKIKIKHLIYLFNSYIYIHFSFLKVSIGKFLYDHENSNKPIKSHIFLVLSVLLFLLIFPRRGGFNLNRNRNDVLLIVHSGLALTGIGDALAAIFGTLCKPMVFPYSKNKTLAGYIGFVSGSLIYFYAILNLTSLNSLNSVSNGGKSKEMEMEIINSFKSIDHFSLVVKTLLMGIVEVYTEEVNDNLLLPIYWVALISVD